MLVIASNCHVKKDGILSSLGNYTAMNVTLSIVTTHNLYLERKYEVLVPMS